MKTTKERIGFAGTIGDTPLILLESLSKATGCKIYGKAEHLNPGGSVKDRPGTLFHENFFFNFSLTPMKPLACFPFEFFPLLAA